MNFGSEYVFLKSEALKRKARNLNDATTAPSQEPPQPAEVDEKIASTDAIDEDVDEFEEEDLKQGIRTHSIKSTTSTEVRKEKPKATRKFRKVDTNVFRVDLSTLSQEAYMATGDPIFCEKCKAVFSSISKLDGAPQVSAAGITLTVEDSDNPEKGKEKEGEKEEDGKDRSWVCEFCEHENKIHIESEELPQSDTMDFVLEVPGRTELSAEENNVIFCVDTSGSMCVTTEIQGRLQLKLGAEKMANLQASLNPDGGQQYMPGWSRNVTYISRIQCMQAAVGAQLEVLEREQSNKRVGLVSFASDVLITGDGKQESKVVAGDKLHDYEELSRIAAQFALENPISETREALGSRLNALEESGATALGPALLVSVVMASKKPGSKVILCTDGLANIGIGSMETEEEMESAKAFYTRVAEFAKDNGVIINVISIKGTTCSMEILGLLADITSGEVDIVDPLLLTTNFHSILSIPVIAVHVSATVLLHEGLFLRDEEDKYYENRLDKKIGSVTKESNLTVEYGCKQGFQLDESITSLPFQVQIHYTKLDGTKMVRVVSKAKPITTKREEAEQNMDRKVLGLNSVKKSARYAQSGDYESARLHGYSTTRLMSRNLDEHSISEYSAYVSAAEALDSELLTAQIEEESERPGTLNNYGYDISGGSEERKTRRLVTRAKSKDTTSKTIYRGTSAGYTIFADDAPTIPISAPAPCTSYPAPSTSDNSVGPSSEPNSFGYRLTPVNNIASTGDNFGYAVSSSSPPGEESTTSTTATTDNNFGYQLSSGKPNADE